MNDEQAVPTADIARLLTRSEKSVQQMARAGTIPGFKVGHSWRFFPSKVLAHLEKPAPMWYQSNRSRARKRVA